LIFIEKIKQRLVQNTKAVGIECILQSDNTFVFHVVVLEKKKGEINILKSEKDLVGFDSIKNLLQENLPIHLTLNGKGILHKTVSEDFQNDYQLLQTVLPNATTEDFVIQKTALEQGLIASIIRKEILVKILLQFSEAQLWVTQTSLGSFDIKYLIPFLEKKSTVTTSTQIIEFNSEGEINRFSKRENLEETNIKLGDEFLSNKNLLSYAGAFQILLQIPNALSLPQIETNQQEFFHQQIFKKAGVGILASFFIILILNTFFFYQLKDKNQELSGQLFLQQGQLTELDALKSKLAAQENFFKATNLNQNSKASFYADQIAESVPKGIQFSILEIFPAIKKKSVFQAEEQLQQFDKETILIKGFCKSSLTYNEWLKKLKELDWIKEVNHLDYKDVDNRLAEFEMKIII